MGTNMIFFKLSYILIYTFIRNIEIVLLDSLVSFSFFF